MCARSPEVNAAEFRTSGSNLLNPFNAMQPIEEWLKKERYNISKGKRCYLHFDPRVSPSKVLSIITDPTKISQRAFYPFIKYTSELPRYKRQSDSSQREISIKKREICYASHMDSLIYSWYSFQLNRLYETELKKENLTDCVIAFRKLGKCNIHFANEAFEYIKSKGECIAIAYDISGFFDNLDHEIVKRTWIEVLHETRLPEDHFAIYKTLTSFSFVDRDKLFSLFDLDNEAKRNIRRICSPLEFRNLVRKQNLLTRNKSGKGIPQGSPISALLSNMYMLPFDKAVLQLISGYNGFYRRYCDDILIICDKDAKDNIESKIQDLLQNDQKLQINKDKTEIIEFKYNTGGDLFAVPLVGNCTSLQYLGFEFDGKRISVDRIALQGIIGK
jgi:hypothetical protein